MSVSRKIVFLAAAITVAALFVMHPSAVPKFHEKSTLLLYTVIKITAAGNDTDSAIDEIFTHTKNLAVDFDNKEKGDISRLNAAPSGEYVPLSENTWHILSVADKYARATDGAFTANIGALTSLWNIGKKNARIPSDEEITRASYLADYHRLHFRESNMSAMRDDDGVKLHLGGFAKGFIADEARKILERRSVKNALIDIGTSSMYAMGKNPKNEPWQIGIKNPRQNDGYFAVASLSDAALSTSAATEQFFEIDGKRYGHILNPATGKPADTDVLSVTIVVDGTETDGALIADIVSTAVFVMGKEKGGAFVASLPETVSAAIVDNDGKVTAIHKIKNYMKIVDDNFSWE